MARQNESSVITDRDLDAFWQRIERVRGRSLGSIEAAIEAFHDELHALDDERLVVEANVFYDRMRASYSWPLWGGAYVIHGGCSDDGFWDFRACLVALGRDVFDRALNDPDSLADLEDIEELTCAEGFQYVPGDLLEERGLATAVSAVPLGEPAGERWKKHDLPTIYPRLWARFGVPIEENVIRGAEILRRGGLVAFPTETVYGLGALALDAMAVRKIFEAKGRPATNPVIVHISDIGMLSHVTSRVPEMAHVLAARFWPGPLTLVMPKHPDVPDVVTAGGATVAVRMPSHPLALALIRAVGAPIAAPSANRSTGISPTIAEHVRVSLGDRVEMVIDGGACERGIESTVVDTTGEMPVILRPGSITRRQIFEALYPNGESALFADVATRTAVSSMHDVARSPGQQERHYAPSAQVVLVPRAEILDAFDQRMAGFASIGLLTCGGGDYPMTEWLDLPADPSGYAAGLYAALHALDDRCDLIVIELPPDGDAWEAVHDRLRRAARPAP